MFLEKKLNCLFRSICKFIERQNIELIYVFKPFLEVSLSAVIPTVIWGMMSHTLEYSANLFWTSSQVWSGWTVTVHISTSLQKCLNGFMRALAGQLRTFRLSHKPILFVCLGALPRRKVNHLKAHSLYTFN